MDKKISHAEATALEYIVRSVFNCERFGVMGVADRLIKKVRISLAYEGKISLAMRNQTMQRMKIDFAEGWQTRGT